VLEEKLEAVRSEFRKVRKTFNNELEKSQAYPSADVRNGRIDHRQWAGLQTYNHHKDLVERLFDLKVLDPAMGSGHFLVEAVDFVTDRLLNFLNAFPINPVNFALDRTRQSILESLGQQGVTVDPAKLTDINLLKRHVLKRCIYGVDLNPMAVELAKVSLWLDAFTLGAPLNFLDHHLRCGNSLIGATFEDLRQALSGRLFGIDYEPLLRAIRHVLFVSKLPGVRSSLHGQYTPTKNCGCRNHASIDHEKGGEDDRGLVGKPTPSVTASSVRAMYCTATRNSRPLAASELSSSLPAFRAYLQRPTDLGGCMHTTEVAQRLLSTSRT
jgi:hypothetical protein